jgi:hypothetical protein
VGCDGCLYLGVHSDRKERRTRDLDLKLSGGLLWLMGYAENVFSIIRSPRGALKVLRLCRGNDRKRYQEKIRDRNQSLHITRTHKAEETISPRSRFWRSMAEGSRERPLSTPDFGTRGSTGMHRSSELNVPP